MDEDTKKKWVAALRSGKYEQGRGLLRNKEDRYCCLGVLCDVIDPTKWSPDSTGFTHGYEESDVALPSDVVKVAGLTSNDPEIAVEYGVTSLITLNDAHHWTFEQIADIIEKQL